MRKKLFSVTLKDCDMQSFSAGGAGGQHRDHGNSAVRITHRASGATGTASDSRSHAQNKKNAWARMVASPKFRVWLNRKIFELDGKQSTEEKVKSDMKPDNLRVEVYDKEQRRWKCV